jgi:hypothetical protein
MAVNSVSDIFRVLGPPQRRAMLRSSGGALINRTTWPCGCVADHVDTADDGAQWEKCPAHKLEYLPRFAVPESQC